MGADAEGRASYALRTSLGFTTDGVGLGIARAGIEVAGAGDFGEGLHQLGGAGEADFGVVPVAQIDDLLVGAELQGAGVALDQVDEPGGVGETVVAQVI